MMDKFAKMHERCKRKFTNHGKQFTYDFFMVVFKGCKYFAPQKKTYTEYI